MKITAKQRKEARNNEGSKYIPLNIEGYDFKIGYGLDLKDSNILVNNYSLTLNNELVIAWNTWSKLENKIDEIMMIKAVEYLAANHKPLIILKEYNEKQLNK